MHSITMGSGHWSSAHIEKFWLANGLKLNLSVNALSVQSKWTRTTPIFLLAVTRPHAQLRFSTLSSEVWDSRQGLLTILLTVPWPPIQLHHAIIEVGLCSHVY